MAVKRFPAEDVYFWSGIMTTRSCGVRSPEQAGGLLVEQIAIDLIAADEADAMLPVRAFGAQAHALFFQISDLLGVFKAGFQPAFAVQRVPDEIRRHAAGNRVKGERQNDSAKAGANDHSARMRRFA